MKKKSKQKCPICKGRNKTSNICCSIECDKIRKRIYWRNFHRVYDKTPKGRLVKHKKQLKRRKFEGSVIHDFTKDQWNKKLKRSKGICKCCNRNVGIKNLTLDHRYPVSKAYKDFLRTGRKRVYSIRSVDCLCGDCNSTKGANPKII